MLGIFPLHQIFANIKSVSLLVLLFVRQCEIGTLLFTWTLPAFPPLWLTNDLYGDTLKPCEYSCTHFSAQKSSANAYLLIKKARQERSLRNPNDKVGPYVMPCNKVDRARLLLSRQHRDLLTEWEGSWARICHSWWAAPCDQSNTGHYVQCFNLNGHYFQVCDLLLGWICSFPLNCVQPHFPGNTSALTEFLVIVSQHVSKVHQLPKDCHDSWGHICQNDASHPTCLAWESP